MRSQPFVLCIYLDNFCNYVMMIIALRRVNHASAAFTFESTFMLKHLEGLQKELIPLPP